MDSDTPDSDRQSDRFPAGLTTAAAGRLLEELAVFVAVLTPDAQVRYVNQTSLTAAAVQLDDLRGLPLWLTPWWRLDESLQAQVRLACERAAHGESVHQDLPMGAPGKERVTAELSITPILDENRKVVQLAVWAIDVSAQRRDTRASVDRARRKDEFLAMLAHELRNPLAPLRHAAALMRLGEEGPEQRRAISALIDRQVEQMARLLDDLLDASRIDQGRISLSLEPVDLAGLLTQTIDGMRSVIDSRAQRVLLTLPPGQAWLSADPVRLTQIIENLVTNASKFTDPEGTIRVTLALEASTASLSVADNGQGIDADLLPKVFDLFIQGARSLDRSQGGLGIGLSLVRNLAELHGGHVTAHSAGPGCGSEFVVTLPLLPQQAEPPSPPPPAEHPFTAKRILVVDDNVDAAESLAELLMLKGHETKAVTDPRTALEVAPAFSPEVILLDIGLPDIDGFQVARRLRQMAQTRDALLVAVTGYGQAEDRKASSAAGFDYHLVKPVNLRQLEAMIDQQG